MKRLLLMGMLLLAAGCASVSVQKYHMDKVYPPTAPGSVVVFPEKPQGRSFTELGEITVTGANDWAQVEKIFRSKSAEMGADAVYVFSKQEETREYVSPEDCYVHDAYYYPYNHFGWHHYHPGNYYPRGYYYCYGYQSMTDTATFVSSVGIAIKYTGSAP